MESMLINRIKRNPQKFDSFELYTKLCAKNSLDIRELSSVDAVVDLVKNALKDNRKNLNLVFGKRVESMFAVVAASLGRCSLIKQEDGGEAYCNDNISIPDYRVVLKNGNNFLVEVKNYHKDPFSEVYSFTEEYFNSVLKYSALVGCDVKFAIYISKINYWTLIPHNAFLRDGKKYIITIENALKNNEMLVLGDQMLATRSPLEVYLISDPSKTATLDNDTGKANFTIKDTLMYCAGKRVTGELEKKLVFYFTMCSNWVELESSPIIAMHRLIGIRFVFGPHDGASENFDILGNISSMVSTMYKLATEDNGEVTAVETDTHPKNYTVVIPEDYKSDELPLWRFNIQANNG